MIARGKIHKNVKYISFNENAISSNFKLLILNFDIQFTAAKIQIKTFWYNFKLHKLIKQNSYLELKRCFSGCFLEDQVYIFH